MLHKSGSDKGPGLRKRKPAGALAYKREAAHTLGSLAALRQALDDATKTPGSPSNIET